MLIENKFEKTITLRLRTKDIINLKEIKNHLKANGFELSNSAIIRFSIENYHKKIFNNPTE